MSFTSPTHNLPFNNLCSPYTLRILMLLPYNYADASWLQGAVRSGGKVQFNIFIFIFCTAVAWLLRRPCLDGGAGRGRAQSSLLPRESLGSVQLRCPGPPATQQPPSTQQHSRYRNSATAAAVSHSDTPALV